MTVYLNCIIFCCVFLTTSFAAKERRIQKPEQLKIPKLSDIEHRQIFLDEYFSVTHNESQPQLGIVNGNEAPKNVCNVLWLVFSDGKQRWFCGGSLIDNVTVMTAAHCAYGALWAWVVVGAHDLAAPYEKGRRVYSSKNFIIHEEYDKIRFYNDIAIIKLTTPVTLSENVCTTAIPSCNESNYSPLRADSDNKNNYTAYGWGKTSDKKTTSKLMQMVVPQEPQKTCAYIFKTIANYTLRESQMCTSGSGGQSTCNGDSGGPLMQLSENGTWIQRGIVSLGASSCEKGYPSVYTDVADIIKWICEHI